MDGCVCSDVHLFRQLTYDKVRLVMISLRKCNCGDGNSNFEADRQTQTIRETRGQSNNNTYNNITGDVIMSGPFSRRHYCHLFHCRRPAAPTLLLLPPPLVHMPPTTAHDSMPMLQTKQV
nr:uncharacterized protein LOC108131637 [Drosophila bipectinata]